MAKKKRLIVEEEPQEYEFTPTEFNEREFILKDIYSTKIFAVCMVAGLIVGIIGAALILNCPIKSDNGQWYYMSIVATVIAFVVMALLKKVNSLLGFHPELMDAKTLAGHYLVYLMFALGVCIIGIQFGTI